MPVKNITETEPVFAERSVTRNPNGSHACLREWAKPEVSPIAFMDGFTLRQLPTRLLLSSSRLDD
jgi:hypothetical protein